MSPIASESFVSDIHARDHRVRARMASDAEGNILAMDVEDVTGIGAFLAYPRTSVVEGNQVYRLMGAPYTFRNYSRCRRSAGWCSRTQVQIVPYGGRASGCLHGHRAAWWT